jgi:hypothetical protein
MPDTTQAAATEDDPPPEVPKTRLQVDALFAKHPTSDVYARRSTTVLADIVDGMGTVFMQSLWMHGGLIRSLADRIVVLEVQLAAVQLRGFNYAGVWKVGEGYVAGCFVTHDGSLWHCNAETHDRPGTGSTAWVLAVKRGKDARS